ncbi:MAG: TetR family transcriptional regulator [Streptosporangiales bacterium]|nr:TetR family transcriptional regulator [Streptosporangiales bacterium]
MDQRKALLEAAISCLQQRGYARTTTRDIVAAAGAHLPAVNYYFGSKERLLAAAIVEVLRRWAQATMEIANDPSPIPAQERLHRTLDGFLGSLAANHAYVVSAMEAFAQAPRNDELRDRLADEYQLARDEIAATITAVAKDEGGALDGVETEDLASVLLALFDGLAIQWLMDPDRVPSADRAVRSLRILASAVADPMP